MLGVDVNAEVGPGPQQLLEPRYGFGADPGLANIGIGHGTDVARPVGDPVERMVVKGQ